MNNFTYEAPIYMDVKAGYQRTSMDFYIGTFFKYPGQRSDFMVFHSGRKIP